MRIIPGSSGCNSIPSSSRGRSNRTRFFPPSSVLRSIRAGWCSTAAAKVIPLTLCRSLATLDAINSVVYPSQGNRWGRVFRGLISEGPTRRHSWMAPKRNNPVRGSCRTATACSAHVSRVSWRGASLLKCLGSTGNARERHGLFRCGALVAARLRRPSIQCCD